MDEVVARIETLKQLIVNRRNLIDKDQLILAQMEYQLVDLFAPIPDPLDGAYCLTVTLDGYPAEREPSFTINRDELMDKWRLIYSRFTDRFTMTPTRLSECETHLDGEGGHAGHKVIVRAIKQEVNA